MRIFTGAPVDRAAWLAAWERTGREPFAHPDYVSLFAQPGDQTLTLLWQGSGCEVLLPLLRRPLPGQEWTDVISPYGYGGPFVSGNVEWAAFYPELLAWMRRERVLTGFLRVSLNTLPPPFADLPGYEAAYLSDNIVVDVCRPGEQQWAHYEHKVRKNVKKAERAGLRVEIQPDFRHLDAFLEIYHGTMQRRSASGWYYFGREFFQAFDTSLRGQFVVAEVYDAGERLVSTELVLQSDHFLYSFLGGTRQEAFAHAPNDLLKHAVIGYGREQDKKGYVLGGGYAPGDGIFRYKRAFDPVGVRPFYGVRLTADTQAYEQLAETRTAELRREQPGAAPLPGFFPAYRAPAAATGDA